MVLMKYSDTAPPWTEVRASLKYFKLTPEAFAPEWATEHSACFDLKACLPQGTKVKIFDTKNNSVILEIGDAGLIYLLPNHRALIPTGLIFDIPIGYSMRLHARSGLALKQALVLANQEGVVDSDYVEPTFVVLHNLSETDAKITNGDRIAQAEMVPDIAYEVLETPDKPQHKTDRKGGFGSTGIK